MLVARILLAALGVPAVAFLFGWSVLSRCTRLDRAERFAASFGVGIGAFALSEFIAFLSGSDQASFNGGVLLGMLAIAVVCSWRAGGVSPLRTANLRSLEGSQGADAPRSPGWLVPLLWTLGYIHLLLVQFLLPIYLGSYWYWDWYMHSRTALIFRGFIDIHDVAAGYSLPSRTPVFNLTAAFAQSLLGDEFFIYQIVASFLSWCFVAPLYLVLRDLAGERPARLALVLAPLNLWMLHLAWFTWPKLLTTYFLLLGLHCYLRFVQERQTDLARAWRYFLGSWTWALVGLVTHQVVLLYIAALGLHALILAMRDRGAVWLRLGRLVCLGAVFVAIIGPWYGWLLDEFGLEAIRTSTPVTVMDREKDFSPLRFLMYLGFNLLASSVPLHLLDVSVRGPHTWQAFYGGLTQFYFSVLSGALTLSLGTFLGVIGFRWLKDGCPRAAPDPRRGALWLFSVFGLVGGTLLHPLPIEWGVAHAALFPVVVLLAGLAWMVLGREGGGWPRIVAGGMLLEFFGMFWSHVWLVVAAPNVLDPGEPNGANTSYKFDYQCRFLNDLVGLHEPLTLGITLVMQLGFVALLLYWLWPKAPPEANGVGRD